MLYGVEEDVEDGGFDSNELYIVLRCELYFSNLGHRGCLVQVVSEVEVGDRWVDGCTNPEDQDGPVSLGGSSRYFGCLGGFLCVLAGGDSGRGSLGTAGEGGGRRGTPQSGFGATGAGGGWVITLALRSATLVVRITSFLTRAGWLL